MSRRRSPRDAALIKALRTEVRRLRKIEHAAWHALDNAAEYPERFQRDGDGPHARIAWADWLKLHKLLPVEHP